MKENNNDYQTRIKLRNDILIKFKSKCAYCGKQLNKEIMSIDHVIPQSEFNSGSIYIPYFFENKGEISKNSLINLFPCCERCNRIKADLNIENFRIYISYFAKLKDEFVIVDNKVKFYFEFFI